MRLLLDTHTFLWWITDQPSLSDQARSLIGETGNEIFFSAASAWEIGIKTALGKLSLRSPLEEFIPQQLALNAFQSLSVSVSHALRVAALPVIHRDPFDRLLVAQSQLENLPIISSDPLLPPYGVTVIW